MRRRRPGLAASRGGRDLAFRILLRVEADGAYAAILLRGMPSNAPARERALATELVMGTLRWQGRLDHAIEQFADRPVARMDPALRIAVRLGAYQILHLERIPASAAVNESVRLARREAGRSAGGFVNAVLRAMCRHAPRWPSVDDEGDVAARLAVEQSHPAWLVRRWLARYGEAEAVRALETNNRPAPTTLRANRLRVDPEALGARLRKEGVETEPGRWSRDALRVVAGVPADSPAFRRGWFYLQDEASQLVSSMVAPEPGERVADLCSAPGGKATDLAARLGGRGWLLAADLRYSRISLVRANARRLGVPGLHLLVQDARRSALPRDFFHHVLLDAPCSGTGILRRHPEIRWRRREADLGRLAAAQSELLRGAADLVKPGGTLVYSVCSVEPEEGVGVVSAFLEERPDFQIVDPTGPGGPPAELIDRGGPGPHLRTLPHVHDIDGFFAASMVRRGATGAKGLLP